MVFLIVHSSPKNVTVLLICSFYTLCTKCFCF